MIENLTINGIATYVNNGVHIDNLKKVNFIYGANGSGKTTISNFIYNPDDEKFKNCSLIWKNSQPLNTLIYNKEFRERNFGNGKLNGIFTLGEATTDQIKIIDDKVEQLKTIKIKYLKERNLVANQVKQKEDSDKEFTEICWKRIYKKYDKEFKEAFVGSMKSGESFKKRLLQESTSNTEDLLDLKILKEKAKTIFGELPKSINLLNTISYDRIIEIENNVIWKKIVVGKADVEIAKLINKLQINDWVNEGRVYIQEDETCPFCQQQTISDDFKSQIENFFDEGYLKDISSIKELMQEYYSLTLNLINELNIIEGNQKDFTHTKLNLDKFSAYLKTLVSQIATNNQVLNNKVKEPSRNLELISLKEQLDLIAELITITNSEIKIHNEIVVNFNNEKSELIKSIWKFIIDEFRAEITGFNKKINGLEAGISKLETQLASTQSELKTLDKEIKNLSKNVSGIKPPINEINTLLKSYGFLNFKIVPAEEEGFYQIQREDGTIAEATLSEGEITFITFLYFLQLAKGGISEETVNEERVLIIDDPISSLDSNILFVVSTLIKEIIKSIKSDSGNIKQLILLTHNVYFHKEVTYEGARRNGENSQYWILRKNIIESTISYYSDKNPIQSSYELLWREVREWENNSGITIQNILRRILENYFSILGSKRDDVLINKFPNQEEREICRSLISWANEGSHTLPDDLFIEAPDGTITKYLAVFEDIFKYTENIGHYNMMMGIELAE